MNRDTLLIMWKRSNVSCSAIIYYHSLKFVDLSPFTGVNPDSSIDLLHESIEVLIPPLSSNFYLFQMVDTSLSYSPKTIRIEYLSKSSRIDSNNIHIPS